MNSCEDCKKSFSSRSNLVRHIKAQHKNLSLRCEKCNLSFALKSELKSHAKTHVHSCEWCEKTFLHKANLLKHVVTCWKKLNESSDDSDDDSPTHIVCRVCQIQVKRRYFTSHERSNKHIEKS